MVTSRERALSAFAQASDEKLQAYLEWLRDTLSKLEDSTRRTVFYISLLAIVFELLVFTPSPELSVGPLKLSDSSGLLSFFPTAVAVFAVELMVNAQKYSNYRTTFAGLFEKWLATAKDKEIHDLVMPPSPLYLGLIEGESSPASVAALTKFEWRVEIASSLIALIVMTILPLAFGIQAFVLLFIRLGPSSVLLWVNLVVSAGLFAIVAYFVRLDVSGRDNESALS